MQKETAENSLTALLKAKQLSAFHQFYAHYAPALFGDVRRRLHLQKAAEETLANACIKMWQSIDHYDPSKERLFTWSLKVTREETCKVKARLALEALFACRRPVSHTS